MTKGDLREWMRKNQFVDAWRVALENEAEPRDEVYTLDQASGLLVDGGWRVKIVPATEFNNPGCEWLDFESKDEPLPPSEETVIGLKEGGKKSKLFAICGAALLLAVICSLMFIAKSRRPIPQSAPSQSESKESAPVDKTKLNPAASINTEPQPSIVAAEPAYLTIKSFCLGMTLSDFEKLVTEKYGLKLGRPFQDASADAKAPQGTEIIVNDSYPHDEIWAVDAHFNANNEMINVYLAPWFVNKIFNVSDMDAKTFIQELINNYGIPTMTPDVHTGLVVPGQFMTIDQLTAASHTPTYFWYYTDGLRGVNIKVTDSKAMQILRVPNDKQRKFDDGTGNSFTKIDNSPVVKGFYIGMGLEDFKKLLINKYGLEMSAPRAWSGNLTEVEATAATHGGAAVVAYFETVHTSAQKSDLQCEDIVLQPWFVDKIFNASDLNGADFAQRFLASYEIPSFKADIFPHAGDKSNPNPLGWHYEDSKNGWKIIIFESKTVQLQKIPKSEDRHFD